MGAWDTWEQNQAPHPLPELPFQQRETNDNNRDDKQVNLRACYSGNRRTKKRRKGPEDLDAAVQSGLGQMVRANLVEEVVFR